jgi:hypothetical protein
MYGLRMPQIATASRLIKIRTVFGASGCMLVMLVGGLTVSPQTRSYPKEIRGYKVERTVVEVKKPDPKNQRSGNSRGGSDGVDQADAANSESDVDALIQLGKPQLAHVTPLGIYFAVPIVVAPVKQSGHVDFLVFEDMVINGTSVDIDEYQHAFDLPNKQSLTLGDPLRIYIYLPSAMLAALGDWSDSKEMWPVTGRVYVFGRFKKSVFSFKRVIPVELKVTMQNPLRQR